MFPQKAVEERVNHLSKTRDGDEKRFASHDVPWPSTALQDVKNSSMRAVDIYLQGALREARRVMASKLPAARRRQQALSIVRGAMAAPVACRE